MLLDAAAGQQTNTKRGMGPMTGGGIPRFYYIFLLGVRKTDD
jgi:hypothetical protein